MISILTKGQNTNPWSIDMKAIHVVDKEDRFFAGKDEPYMLQIGFRTTIGKDCSSKTTTILIPPHFLQQFHLLHRSALPVGSPLTRKLHVQTTMM